MVFYGSQLKGGPFDGDRGDIGEWPDVIWAWRDDLADQDGDVHWAVIAPKDVVRAKMQAQKRGIVLIGYHRHKLEGGAMTYVFEEAD